MPFCYVAPYQSGEDGVVDNGIKIFYRTYGHGPIKVLMIIGLAGTHDSWLPQIEGLTGTVIPNDDQLMAAVDHRDAAAELGGDGDDESGGVEVCAFDNRGMGCSSVPTKKSDYATTIMAKDAVALMDHLGWRKAHVFGHSMGAMISCKLAAMVPERVLSLALLNVTGGGYQCLPKLDRKTLSIAIRFLRAKTPEQRAAVDLDTHYSKVNQALVELIQASEKKMNPYDWTNIHKKNSGSAVISFKPNFEGGSKLSFMIYILEKLHVFVLYFFSLFVLAFEYLRRGLKSLKPVKVGPALTCSI